MSFDKGQFVEFMSFEVECWPIENVCSHLFTRRYLPARLNEPELPMIKIKAVSYDGKVVCRKFM
ncbi:hypothetical protein GCM10022277_27710 [Litoribacillus peritrichatus]|uniref:Uncharacterized protein n=1 Tax=Litoribacillus peritrichatus TaxID=718191 RepID=A0ABP7MST6_9GAMM